MALYSGHGSGLGVSISVAAPADISDPLLTNWTKNVANPLLAKPPNNGRAFRDPSTAWKSGGQWRMVLACESCTNGTFEGSASLYSSMDFVNWTYTGSMMGFDKMIECPDFFPVTLVKGSAPLVAPLHVLK